MKGFEFPIVKTKFTQANGRKFSLDSPAERKEYFQLKAGAEIEKLKKFLEKNTFVAILLGKKNSGKGTYIKLFSEIVGGDHVAHLSIGDTVRAAHKELESGNYADLTEFLKRRYRGFLSVEKALEAITGRDTKTLALLPTEVILALIERQIDKIGKKAIFIDGFPRELDQISYSIFLRAIMGYRDDPDFFVMIDLPESIIDARMRGRVICPKCQVPRHPKVLKTNAVGYDQDTKEFYLICDNPECGGARMVYKEGDDQGIEAMRERIDKDDKIMRTLLELQGVPKILLRNSIPVSEAQASVDDYEITPAYSYEWDEANKKVIVKTDPWVVNDDNGIPSHSLLPAPVVLAFIKQMTAVLGL
ncbi:MAG: hypothetical protein UY30_C0004G0010 [Parcubacteria group bacterium GW2011_GWB1_48_6]|nr:MAG: hypothetical protein UY30_C0004G0010 [Parcubacteria group bacterium GW2011_GWB1_48_6]HXK35476.1 nucleoside monophosphate kinase [Candidatus Paceibacterota bacterium]